MANTTKLKNDVEKWYLQTLIVDKENENIKKEVVDLIWGGKFEFDAVIREENEIVEVYCLSTSKYNTGQLHKIKDDALMLTGVRHSIKKVIAFTDLSLYKRVKEEQLKGRFPIEVDLILIENLPKEIIKTIAEIKEKCENEQKYKPVKKIPI